MVATRLPQPKIAIWEVETGTERIAPFPEGKSEMNNNLFQMNNNPFQMVFSSGWEIARRRGWHAQLLCVYELATGREIHRFCDASTSTISPDGNG